MLGSEYGHIITELEQALKRAGITVASEGEASGQESFNWHKFLKWVFVLGTSLAVIPNYFITSYDYAAEAGYSEFEEGGVVSAVVFINFFQALFVALATWSKLAEIVNNPRKSELERYLEIAAILTACLLTSTPTTLTAFSESQTKSMALLQAAILISAPSDFIMNVTGAFSLKAMFTSDRSEPQHHALKEKLLSLLRAKLVHFKNRPDDAAWLLNNLRKNKAADIHVVLQSLAKAVNTFEEPVSDRLTERCSIAGTGKQFLTLSAKLAVLMAAIGSQGGVIISTIYFFEKYVNSLSAFVLTGLCSSFTVALAFDLLWNIAVNMSNTVFNWWNKTPYDFPLHLKVFPKMSVAFYALSCLLSAISWGSAVRYLQQFLPEEIEDFFGAAGMDGKAFCVFMVMAGVSLFNCVTTILTFDEMAEMFMPQLLNWLIDSSSDREQFQKQLAMIRLYEDSIKAIDTASPEEVTHLINDSELRDRVTIQDSEVQNTSLLSSGSETCWTFFTSVYNKHRGYGRLAAMDEELKSDPQSNGNEADNDMESFNVGRSDSNYSGERNSQDNGERSDTPSVCIIS